MAVDSLTPNLLELLQLAVPPDQRGEPGARERFQARARGAFVEHPVDLQRRGDTLEWRGAQRLIREEAAEEVVRQSSDNQCVWLSHALQSGRDVGCVAEHHIVVTGPTHFVTDHHQPGMAPQPNGQRNLMRFRQDGVELSDRLDDAEPRADRALCVIFVGVGVTEIDQQAVAKILRDVTVEAGDHLGACVVVGAYDLAPFFGIELTGQCR